MKDLQRYFTSLSHCPPFLGKFIPLTPETVALCRALRDGDRANGVPRVEDVPAGLLFKARTGNFLAGPKVANRFKTMAKRIGRSQARFHDLRHTMASLLLQANVHVKIVSERLGHSRIETTLNVYSHLLPTVQAQAVEVLQAVLKQSAVEDEWAGESGIPGK